ncbi:hypothetical protein FA014_18560, partial [Cellulomonas hominis]
AHLDRPFEYLVPATLAQAAAPGTRVKVRFGAQDVDGYVLDRTVEPEQRRLLGDTGGARRRGPVRHPVAQDRAERSASTRSVRSQVNSGSARPKWPYAAVFR